MCCTAHYEKAEIFIVREPKVYGVTVLHNKSRNMNKRLKYGSISPKKASHQVCVRILNCTPGG